MIPLNLRKHTAEGAILLALLVFLLVAFMAWRALQGGRDLIFADMETRVATLSKRAGMAMYPRVEPFSLHAAVSIISSDNIIEYALITDASGLIRSHSDPEYIGDTDRTPEGENARRSTRALRQVYSGRDGLTHYYFSAPIVVGTRRVGTAALAISAAAMAEHLAPARHRLWTILAALAVVMALLLVVRGLLKKVSRAAELKSAMIHTVSHEFNNALASLEGGVFLLREGDPHRGDGPRAEMYQMLADVQGSLRLFVQNVLNEARMESGRFKTVKGRVVLKDLAEKFTAGLEPVIRQKSIRLAVERPEPVPVYADREVLALVVSNLIGNAVKYTPEGGLITIRIGRDAARPGVVTFLVRNTGTGLTAAEIARLREGFYRTSDGKTRSSGFGLGMKIINEMLRLHGTALVIASEPGKNSTFSFSLPEYDERMAAASPLAAAFDELVKGVTGRFRR
jgi:signal transduction histidine kinase